MLLFLLTFLIPAVFTHICNSIAELISAIGILHKEPKSQIETHPVTAEIKISAKYNSKLSKLFYTSFLLIHFYLFLQLNNLLFHLHFSL